MYIFINQIEGQKAMQLGTKHEFSLMHLDKTEGLK